MLQHSLTITTLTKGNTTIKKYCSKLLAILCAACLTISAAVPAFAADISNEPQEYATTAVTRGPITFPVSFGSDDIALYDQFAAMSTAELTAYLNALSPTNQSSSYNTTPTSDAIDYQLALKGIIASIALLVKVGYPCAAELVLYALADEDYTETDGIFTDKIMETQLFQSWITTATSAKDVELFTKADDSDLYLLTLSERRSIYVIRIPPPESCIFDRFAYLYLVFLRRSAGLSHKIRRQL